MNSSSRCREALLTVHPDSAVAAMALSLQATGPSMTRTAQAFERVSTLEKSQEPEALHPGASGGDGGRLSTGSGLNSA